MKKILALILCVCLAMAVLTACEDKGSNNQSTNHTSHTNKMDQTTPNVTSGTNPQSTMQSATDVTNPSSSEQPGSTSDGMPEGGQSSAQPESTKK